MPEAVSVPEAAIGTEEIPEVISVEEAEEIISTDVSYSGLSVKNANAKPVVIGADVLAQGNLVYLGTKSENYTWTDERPTWLVLDPKKANNGTAGYAFLLSQELIGERDGGTGGNVYFDKDANANPGQTNPNEWQGSDAQAWCRTFLTGVFSAGEQAAILETNKTDEVFTNNELNDDDTVRYKISYGTSSLVNDRIFFLSAKEALTPAYGFPDKNYYNGNPALGANYNEKSSPGVWWLRSPRPEYNGSAGVVAGDGGVFLPFSVNHVFAARPAFNFNLKSVILSSAAAGGKSSGSTGAASLKQLNKQNISGWKFTLADAARRNFAVSKKSYDGKTLVFSYFGAKTGSNEYISAIITDSTGRDIKYYGNVAKASAAIGEASITLTGKIESGDKIFVFNEQLNGDYMTDYASALCEMDLTVDTTQTVPVTSVTLDKNEMSLEAGKTGQLTARIYPADATNKNVTWSSSDTSVATVSSSGLVTGVKAGTATITVKTADSGRTATCTVTVTAPATGAWKKDSKGWWYKRADGTYPKNTWEKIGGKWYHFDAKGYMQTGWQKLGGKWYYLGTNGAMVTGWKQISGKWYYFNSSGAMQTGWVKISGKWYYFNSSGAMQTGWQKISGKWYYFESSGAMLANTSKKIGKKTYHFDKNGVCTNP